LSWMGRGPSHILIEPTSHLPHTATSSVNKKLLYATLQCSNPILSCPSLLQVFCKSSWLQVSIVFKSHNFICKHTRTHPVSIQPIVYVPWGVRVLSLFLCLYYSLTCYHTVRQARLASSTNHI
jgi:hypothetical protein